jgi:hypothetical protein
MRQGQDLVSLDGAKKTPTQILNVDPRVHDFRIDANLFATGNRYER